MAKPVYTLRKGAVQLAAWEKVGEDGRKGYSVKLNRRYKDKATGEWKDSPFFFDNDLLVAAELLREAFAELCVTVGDSPTPAVPAPVPKETSNLPPAQYLQQGADGQYKLVDDKGEQVPF